MAKMRIGSSQVRDWDRITRFAALAWAILLGAVCLRSAIWPRVHSVFPVYHKAAGDLLGGNSLYFQPGTPLATTYRYSPFTALSLVPLHVLPEAMGGIVERILITGVFLLAFHWWLVAGAPHLLAARQRGLILLLSVPLCIGTVNNGQLNLLVIGLLIAAATATVQSRWWLAGVCIAVATGIKVYPLAVGLLFLVLYPRKLALPLLLNLAGVVGLPFLFQDPEYVFRQYVEWYHVVAQDNRKFLPPGSMYWDLWLILRDLQIPVTAPAYTAIQVAGAAGCAALCLLASRRGWSAPALATLALNLGTCWMMLCGPATEACTYAMLAPVIAYLSVVAVRPEAWPRTLRYLPAVAYGIQFSVTFSGLVPDFGPKVRLILPSATLLLTAAYVAAILHELQQQGRALAKDAGGNRTHFYRVAAGCLAVWLQRQI